jgi:hypothetical protein
MKLKLRKILLKPRKIFGIVVIVLIYLSGLLPYMFKSPGKPIWHYLVGAITPIILSPYYLFVLIIGIYFLILKEHRIIDSILIIILVILFLPISPVCTVFSTPGFILWGDFSSPFLICPPTPQNITGNMTEERGVQYIEGNATLEVIVSTSDDTPLKNLEVDLWTADAPPGPPDVGVKYTNESGVAVFKIPFGSYKIGFNVKTFPKGFIYPEQVQVEVTTEIVQKIIRLEAK